MTDENTEPVEAAEAEEAAPQSVEEAAPQPDAVLVIKTTDENGGISTDVMPLGAVQATEVQTLLELAVKGWRSKIGLDSR